MEKTRWVVGPEYDQALRQQLRAALSRCGFEVQNESDGVAGSQELSQWSVITSSGRLEVEAETYIGLTVAGPAHLVELARAEFERAHG